MQPVIYDVAVSMDGYIAGADGDISLFAQDGPVVDAYRDRLATYATAVMGRATYEFGYRFGMEPGVNPYPWARTLVVSARLVLPPDAAVSLVRSDPGAVLRSLKKSSPGPVYMVGGGRLAGWALSAGLIDILRLKRAPCVLGRGTPLFAGGVAPVRPTLTEMRTYPDGYVYQEFALSG